MAYPITLKDILDLEKEKEYNSFFKSVQQYESFAFRAQRRSILLATFIIDDGGELTADALKIALEALINEGRFYYSGGYFDELLFERHLKILRKLQIDPQFYKAIKRFQKPLCHKNGELLIRKTLGITHPILERDIRRAVLSACLTLLRQNIGSCFATAPAILIHEEQIENLLSDLKELLMTGKLKRTFSGVEHSVPLTPISSSTDQLLLDNPLLKAWEFTLASFSEIKMDFSQWNLYSSLGFDVNEKEGIGEIIYKYLQEKLSESNRKVDEAHEHYVVAAEQLRATEILMRNAGSESEIRRLRAEHQSRHYHMQSCLDLRNEVHQQSTHYTTFYNFLTDEYYKKFPEYFQEIYDPEMQENKGGQYDDRPAGFRLIYKYGRSEASVWKLIYDAQEWIEVLIDFFRGVEWHLTSLCETQRAKEDVNTLTTDIIAHLRTRSFLEHALIRASQGVHPGEKKPWSYISGGSMDILVMTYYRLQNELKRESRFVESPLDLLTFLIEVMKSLPPSITDPFLKNSAKGMLMQSPTHAFILHPGWDLFKEAWQDRGFTYSWIRDTFLVPATNFYQEIILSPEEQSFLIDQFSAHLPPLDAHQSRKYFHHGTVHRSILEFRETLLKDYKDEAVVDSFLYNSLPVVSHEEVSLKLAEYMPEEMGKFSITLPNSPFFTRLQLEILAHQYMMKKKPSFDVWNDIAQRSLHPKPLLFADTNWSDFYFGFVVNPGKGSLELWRMNRTGSTGFPMNTWKPFLDGSTKLPWVVYTHPYQYFI